MNPDPGDNSNRLLGINRSNKEKIKMIKAQQAWREEREKKNA